MDIINKKIKNATSIIYDNIEFKSKTEYNFYKALKEKGFDAKYENRRYTLLEGFKPTIKYYKTDMPRKGKKSKNKVYTNNLILSDSKIRSITYTPDFTFKYKDIFVIIEVKGFENDTYPIKLSLFRKLLETYNSDKILFFEIKTKKHLEQAIKIIEEYGTN